MYRRTLSGLCGVALLATGAVAFLPRNEVHADTSAKAVVGATTPFVTIEAEAGKLGGSARVRSISPGAQVPTVATLELEASGYALVELKNTGDSVTLTNTTR